MLYFLAAALIFVSFIYPSKRSVTYLDLLFMWGLFAFNTANPDYGAYEDAFAIIRSWAYFPQGTPAGITERGYLYLAFFSNHILNLSYAQFLILIASLATVLLAIVLRLYLNWNKQNIVLALFLILNYWVMICQCRFYLAVLFVLLGLYYLFSDSSRRGLVLFTILFLLGVSFHTSAIIFVIFLPLRRWKLSHLLVLAPVLIIGVLVIRTGCLDNLLLNFIPAQKMHWLAESRKRTVIGIAALILVRLALVCIEYEAYRYDSKKLLVRTKALKIENAIFRFSVVAFSFVVLELFGNQFERLFRLSLILSLIFFAIHLGNVKTKNGKVPITVVYFVVFYIVYMIRFYIAHSMWFETVLVPVFTQNSLLNI